VGATAPTKGKAKANPSTATAETAAKGTTPVVPSTPAVVLPAEGSKEPAIVTADLIGDIVARVTQQVATSLATSLGRHDRRKANKIECKETFDGHKDKLRDFWGSLNLVWESQPERFEEDRSKILYTAAHLTGNALQWFNIWTETPWKDRPEYYSKWELFKTEMDKQFGDKDYKRRLVHKLLTLRQKGSYDNYVRQFRQYVNELKWDFDSEPVCALFYMGMQAELKDRLVHEAAPPWVTTKLVEMARSVNNRFLARADEEKEEAKRTSGRTVPTRPNKQTNTDAPNTNSSEGGKGRSSRSKRSDQSQSGNRSTETNNRTATRDSAGTKQGTTTASARNKLSEEERKDYRDKGLCYKCGGEGHLARNCPENDAPSSTAKNESGKGKGART
jgi:hypothetical protein